MPHYIAYDSFKTKKVLKKNEELKKKFLEREMTQQLILLQITLIIMIKEKIKRDANEL